MEALRFEQQDGDYQVIVRSEDLTYAWGRFKGRAEKVEHIIKPIKDMFGAVFFISVGMMIIPDMLVEYMWQILLITVVTIIGQMTFSTLGILISGNSLNTAIRGGFSMVQIGEFSFIIATLGTTLGVTSDFLYPIVVCVPTWRVVP